jgi:hypothetical protein
MSTDIRIFSDEFLALPPDERAKIKKQVYTDIKRQWIRGWVKNWPGLLGSCLDLSANSPDTDKIGT